MKHQVKQRIVGTLVIAALLAIFVPVVFHDTKSPQSQISTDIPKAPVSPKIKVPIPSISNAKKQIPDEQSKQSGQTNPADSDNVNSAVGQQQLKALQENELDSSLSVSPKAWVLQLGTFSNRANADRLMKRLRKDNIDVFARQYRDDNGKLMVRIFVGPEIRMDKLKSIQKKIKIKFKINSVIKRYQV